MTEGIQLGISESDYDKAEGVRQSDLKLMAISAAHYKAKIDAPPEPPTPALKMGTLVHRAVLQDRWEYAIRPKGMKFTTKEGIAWRDAQTQEIITGEEHNAIKAMRASAMAHPVARSILDRPGNNEVACFKRDAETGLIMKGRADRLCVDDKQLMVIPDLKTCQHGCAGRDDFSREIAKWQYDIQVGFYLDLFGASFFVFIVVEKEPPYAVACYSVSPQTIAIGRRKYKALLAKVKECTESGIWPAYSTKLEEIDLPEYVMRKEL